MTVKTDPEPGLYTQSALFYPNYRMPLILDPCANLCDEFYATRRYRLYYFFEGSGFLTCEGRSMPFTSPSILCLRAGERVSEVRSSGYRAEAMYFHPDIINAGFSFERLSTREPAFSRTEDQDLYCLKPFCERETGDVRPILLGPQNAIRIRGLFARIGEQIASTNHDSWPCMSRSYFIELLFSAEHVRAMNPALAQVEGDTLVNEVLVYLTANYPERITIHSLTDRFNTNRTTLAERFSKATGTSVIDYLNRLRTHIASLLLRDTTLTVAIVMDRVGFHDPTHFGRVFRAHYGFSPTEYRKAFPDPYRKN
jgi:AraC family L-rhamnose operon regulatory protein RhaS